MASKKRRVAFNDADLREMVIEIGISGSPCNDASSTSMKLDRNAKNSDSSNRAMKCKAFQLPTDGEVKHCSLREKPPTTRNQCEATTKATKTIPDDCFSKSCIKSAEGTNCKYTNESTKSRDTKGSYGCTKYSHFDGSNSQQGSVPCKENPDIFYRIQMELNTGARFIGVAELF
jgi:hypothetical protein